MKNTVLRVIAVKRHVCSFEQSEKKKKGKKKREEKDQEWAPSQNFSIKLGLLSSQPFTLYPSVWLTLQTPAAAQLSFFFARITVPLSIFVSHLCCLKILRTRQKNTFAFDSWRLTERRWRRRRRRHCRWSPACSWTAWSRAGSASPRWTCRDQTRACVSQTTISIFNWRYYWR